ncbi:M20/M25/M40 family metallo-hydrolase [Shewanella litorisediminis]|uniref:M20/M25/M40 family metallo-hydrolase n=1 Tax=Shewanella litorisediminis TaxID=1173586 RepID=A0ABX7G311_9GAMM|nr:M20/M25/M40 family metallo-hydrolase [Shewanella litorisediminis]MCL2917150.1 M20/M25/M40 family metallo-hydrolase [Shewanella litorisediminis]QRH01627.1 M20/M25/M40 family metallo-hydrolase [Shewanella litorisediminis]
MKRKQRLLSLALLMCPLGAMADELWIMTDKDAGNSLQSLLQRHNLQPPLRESHGKLITRLNEDKLLELSALMHKEHNRCGGFSVHATEADALAASLVPVSQARFSFPGEPNQAARVADILPRLMASNIKDTVTSLEAFTNRYYTTSHGENAAHWVKDSWAALAASQSWANAAVYDHADWRQDSVVLTLTGSEAPDEIVVLGGHLDSINGYTTETTRAPGADDNASGMATITEVIRAFMSQGQPRRTIKFIGYAAEEVGLRGSAEIAAEARSQGQNVVAVMQLDMTGFNGSNEDIVLMQDYTDSVLNQFLIKLMDTYHTEISYGVDVCGYGCSDHASWHNQGYPAAMPFESRFNDYNPHIHTAQDTLDKLDPTMEHALNFAKLASSYLVELGFNTGGTGPETGELENGVPLTGLSAAKDAQSYFTLAVPANAENLRFVTSANNGDADMYVKFGAPPSTSDFDCRSWNNGSYESCDLAQATEGTWHVMLKAYSAYSDLSLTGSFDVSTPTPNQPPVSSFSASFNGATGQFMSSASDSDGQLVSWQWHFGDGSTGNGANISHSYAQSGNYTVTLTVTDDDGAGASSSQSFDVTVPEPPQGDIELTVTKATKSRLGSVYVALSWDTGSGNYRVLRDGVEIGTTSRTSYTDRFKVGKNEAVSVSYQVCDNSNACSQMVQVNL